MTALQPGGRALRRRTTAEDIADALREAIGRGDLEDGEELNQVAIARHFGVSRVPVREALTRLQAEGLVDGRPHMRTVVATLSVERVLEVLDLRDLIESHLLERASTRLGPADLADLRELCDRMDRAPDHDTWLQLNATFHDRMYRAGGADVALEVTGQLSARVQRYVRAAQRDGIHRTREANEEHRRILDHIERGDPAGARKQLECHIAGTRERVVAVLRRRAATGAGVPTTT
ncbi:GntR family transcriptional regulator [Blastococcus sp. SYSU D00820]